jgi:hypothetical protein
MKSSAGMCAYVSASRKDRATAVVISCRLTISYGG